MIVQFEKQYLSELYYNGRCVDKKYRFQPNVVDGYKKRIDILNDASCLEALYCINSLQFEELRSDNKGLSFTRVNNQYRIEFEVSKAEDREVIVKICRIIELSNHDK